MRSPVAQDGAEDAAHDSDGNLNQAEGQGVCRGGVDRDLQPQTQLPQCRAEGPLCKQGGLQRASLCTAGCVLALSDPTALTCAGRAEAVGAVLQEDPADQRRAAARRE